jgi:hypothetical protein
VSHVLALAATNVIGALLFAAVYATAGARLLSQSGFLACLLVMFTLVTVLWVRVEARHRALEPLRRIGRVAAGFAVVLLAVPGLLLVPAFWLDSQLPPEAGFRPYLAPLMTLTLISLVLVGVVNIVGSLIAVARGLVAGRSRPVW